MRKVILEVAISLDGKIEGPNGEFDWCFQDQDYGMTEFLKRIDTIFFGRKSYELINKMDETGEYKDPWGNYKNFVFSNTLTEVKKGYTLLSGNIVEKVKELKNGKGKDIWLFGGASLTTTFIEHQLLDVISLGVHPIILGPGKPMFKDLKGRLPLRHTETKTYSSGLIRLSYSIENNKMNINDSNSSSK